MRPWRAGALVFGSSAAVLMLEILAGRLMAPYVGVSLETFTGIIGTVLAGIAIGAAVGGTLADRHDPRRLIGPSLVVGGALSWASLPILRLIGPEVGTGPVAIVVLTAAAFLAPATVLSAVGPMVAKVKLSSLDETGTVVGGLSAAGTWGALAGTFLTGFVLVSALPSRVVVLIIGGLLVVVGAAVSWRAGVRRTGPALGVFLVAAAFGAAALPSPCDTETPYVCVRIEQDPERANARYLVLDRTVHAHVDLDDPTDLELRYVRIFGQLTDALPAGPLDVLHVGGGGFQFPGYIRATRSGSEQVVLEIDPDLPGVAEQHLGFVTSDAIDVRIGDARLGLPGLDADTFDLVLGDAFSSTSVPWHLTTIEVLDEIQRVLRPDGRYVMNVIDGGDNGFARAQLATLRERFSHVAAIVPADGIPTDESVNQVLVAATSPLSLPEIDPEDGVVLTGGELDAFIGDAMVLTDDHAPVDQLLFR